MKMSDLRRMTKQELIDLIVECDYNILGSIGIIDHPWLEEEK